MIYETLLQYFKQRIPDTRIGELDGFILRDYLYHKIYDCFLIYNINGTSRFSCIIDNRLAHKEINFSDPNILTIIEKELHEVIDFHKLIVDSNIQDNSRHLL